MSEYLPMSTRYRDRRTLDGKCRAEIGEGFWLSRCALDPGHGGDHQDIRGGYVIFREWLAATPGPPRAQSTKPQVRGPVGLSPENGR